MLFVVIFCFEIVSQQSREWQIWKFCTVRQGAGNGEEGAGKGKSEQGEGGGRMKERGRHSEEGRRREEGRSAEA